MEFAYLPQRMEEHQGVVVLTTNRHGNTDDAFIRRLQFTVGYPFSDEADRATIWRVGSRSYAEERDATRAHGSILVSLVPPRFRVMAW